MNEFMMQHPGYATIMIIAFCSMIVAVFKIMGNSIEKGD